MRIPSGKTDQYIYFVAYDSTDHATRKTGLTGFTVYRSRNNGAATAYTTPTVAELSAANMPGVYALLLDEDTTIAAGSDSEEYCVHITVSGMDAVTRTVELYRRDTTSGKTITVDASGLADANAVKVGPSGSGTAQTAGDIYALETTIASYVDTEVAAIKAKTDQLTFTTPNQVDATTVTNSDKTNYSLTTGERNSVADSLLDRDMSLGLDSGSGTVRTPRQAFRALRNKWAIVSGTGTIYKEDDATASWTTTVVTTAGTSPVTSSDPAGP